MKLGERENTKKKLARLRASVDLMDWIVDHPPMPLEMLRDRNERSIRCAAATVKLQAPRDHHVYAGTRTQTKKGEPVLMGHYSFGDRKRGYLGLDTDEVVVVTAINTLGMPHAISLHDDEVMVLTHKLLGYLAAKVERRVISRQMAKK